MTPLKDKIPNYPFDIAGGEMPTNEQAADAEVVVITPEMTEAGMSEFEVFDRRVETPETLIERIYLAMMKAGKKSL